MWAHQAYWVGLQPHLRKDSRGKIKTSHVALAHQIAKIFTKTLGKDQFCHLNDKLGIHDIHVPTWGGVMGYQNGIRVSPTNISNISLLILLTS